MIRINNDMLRRFGPPLCAALAACILSFELGRHTAQPALPRQAATPSEASFGQGEASASEALTKTPEFLFKPYVTDPELTYTAIELARPDVLNLACLFSEGADVSQVSESSAGKLCALLSDLDAEWFSGMYDFYNYTPLQAAQFLNLAGEAAVSGRQGVLAEFRNVTFRLLDGQGRSPQTTSNTRAIAAICSVLNYYGVLGTQEDMEAFASSLWRASHSYHAVLGSVYYCDGSCLAQSQESAQAAEESSETSAAEADTVSVSPETAEETDSSSGPEGGPGAALADQSETAAEPSAATASEAEEALCPGHIDLTIQATIRGAGEDGSLFEEASRLLDEAAAPAEEQENAAAAAWPGWNQETMGYVSQLLEQDWYETYQLNVSDVAVSSPLTAEEIDFYMQLVPEDVSQQRRDLVRYALTSVGKIPYYWGGKPGRPGYAGNRFGTITVPDEDGRFLKGLDCSGWISWVYWSVTGHQLGSSSTSTLLSAGTALSRDQLLPGDICIRTGEMAHVIMYLGWSPDGRMVCIQETSADTDNVEVALVDPDWPSYRRIIE